MTALITVVAVVLIFEVCCLVDIARAKEVRRLDRETWALICLVTLPLGGILYLVRKSDLSRAGGSSRRRFVPLASRSAAVSRP